jgi:putative addiction module component (TIGR02574 family)
MYAKSTRLFRAVGASSFYSMPMTLEQIVEETRDLPADVVAQLVDRILVARHGGMVSGVEESWKRETRRRIAEIEKGQAQGIAGEDVSKRIRKTLGR